MENNWLASHRQSVTSQNGEDGVIAKIFEIIGCKNRWCVEFGAGSGKKDNNTWRLIAEAGWLAVLIESDKAVYKDLEQYYKGNKQIVCFNKLVAARGRDSLDNILRQTDIPTDFDLLSIDIDGHDYHVWQALAGYKPRVVLIEFNPKIPIDTEFIQPVDRKISAGSSLLALVRLGKLKGYELVYSHATNAIFVKEELFGLLAIEDNSPATLASGLRPVGRFFESYDGSIVLLDYDRAKLLSPRKKIQSFPVWIWQEQKLYPIIFRRDNRLVRWLKNIIKSTFLYPLFKTLIQKMYGRAEYRRKIKQRY